LARSHRRRAPRLREAAARERPDLIVLEAYWAKTAAELARDPRTGDLRVLMLSPPQ